MNTARHILFSLIEDVPENEILEVISFIGYLKIKREKELYKDLQNISESSLSFWNNDIDDEVWNNV